MYKTQFDDGPASQYVSICVFLLIHLVKVAEIYVSVGNTMKTIKAKMNFLVFFFPLVIAFTDNEFCCEGFESPSIKCSCELCHIPGKNREEYLEVFMLAGKIPHFPQRDVLSL